MIGDWEVPRIERDRDLEGRRLARLAVPGLLGDLHQDLGADSLAVEIVGSLHGDTERDDFLEACASRSSRAIRSRSSPTSLTPPSSSRC